MHCPFVRQTSDTNISSLWPANECTQRISHKAPKHSFIECSQSNFLLFCLQISSHWNAVSSTTYGTRTAISTMSQKRPSSQRLQDNKPTANPNPGFNTKTDLKKRKDTKITHSGLSTREDIL